MVFYKVTRKVKALFRLDSGGGYGLGHVVRSKALADALLKLKVDCTFAVKTIHSTDVVDPHKLIIIYSEDEFLSLAKSYDVIIIDHYDYTTELFFQLSQLENSILVVLDDECNRGNLYADIIINPLTQASLLSYKEMASTTRFFFGVDYILLRSLFNNTELLTFEKRRSIVITFGGSDVMGLTLPVLKLLINSSLMNFNIIVVTGGGCKNRDEISHYCQKQGLTHLHNADDMAALLSTARLAISAAGSTAFELAYCGVPAVFAVVADNQLMSVKEQCKNKWCTMVDCRAMNKPEELIQKAEDMLKNSIQLEKKSQIAQSLIDGQGADRIALKIKQAILS